ncbi:hypothetical protein EUBDOL_02389 [Amedibacillus dolichus DSM 3991]|uniref:Uncharacterized protein n=1 Tax=Amedibacillus dolichus DSM 3991 TaxID=428127 RepID=A8RFX1_9FIRM|nr:hypothetical protein EUBDOL_02389 [Amedibacillus dolichus DSM 3991]
MLCRILFSLDQRYSPHKKMISLSYNGICYYDHFNQKS